MDSEWRQARRDPRRRELTRRRRRALAALSRLTAAGAAISVALLAGCGRSMPTASAPSGSGGAGHELSSASTHGLDSTSSSSAAIRTANGKPGTESVPILMYHVINPPPAGAPFPGLYVSASEFAAQMQALAHAGDHPVTLDQLHSYWLRGTPLPGGKPLVLTFDNGYQSQYTNALPVLRRLGWVADENMQLTGLPPSQGGLSEAQIRGLVTAGWELDTQGFSHADLITLAPSELAHQVAGARTVLQRRYGVPVNWFCYPSGHYDAAVVAEVRAAGYLGSTTVVPGWAGPGSDPYRLPRLRVLGGTSPASLLGQIAAIRDDPPPPESYTG